MPYTAAQIRLFRAKAAGADYDAGPSQAQAKKMLAESKGMRKRRARKIVDKATGGK